jgi:hypothetical protein
MPAFTSSNRACFSSHKSNFKELQPSPRNETTKIPAALFIGAAGYLIPSFAALRCNRRKERHLSIETPSRWQWVFLKTFEAGRFRPVLLGFMAKALATE